MSRCITIYTDASVCPNTFAAAWSCWIKTSPRDSTVFSRAFKEPVKCSTVAELKAIANALVVVTNYYEVQNKILVVVTDSSYAQKYIEIAKQRKTAKAGFKRKQLREDWFEIAQKIHALIPQGCELRVNKVKGHSKSDGARSWVNNLVDQKAKEKMRERRSAA